MTAACFFPELYRLYDREKEERHPPTENELKQLSDMCTLCGLCPCPDLLPALPVFHPLEMMEEAYSVKSSKEKNDA